MRKLTALGHTIQPQVGCAGFFLDLGVVDPVHPGRYLLGIECDGARYHSARSARDRDRLRQCVLEGLGWRIHRIWSTDWVRDPEGELRKVLREIEASQESGPVAAPEPVLTTQAIPDEVELPALVPEMRSQSSKNQPHFYESARVGSFAGTLQLHEVDRRTLARQFSRVVAVEGPVHWREAAHRIVAGAGVQRMGNRIEAAFLERNCDELRSKGQLRASGVNLTVAGPD